MKHEIFARIDTRTAEGRTAPLYINQDQWSGWIFNGDGTATADVYATLWGLAELVTGDGKIFIQIYTDKIKNHTPSTKVLDGFALYEIPTMILTESAYTLDTTIAHEICHNFGLNDIADPNQINNLMYSNNNRTGYNLELDEVNLIKEKLEKYPEPYIRR